MPAPDTAPAPRLGGLTARAVSASFRHPGAAIAAFSILLAIAAVLILTRLRVDPDPAVLMSDELPWRRTALAYQNAFPDQHQNIVAVIDGSVDEARRTADALLLALRDRAAPIRATSAPGLDPFFDRHGLLYLETEALEKLALDLEAAQPLLGRLAHDPGIAGLMSTLQLMLDQPGDESARRARQRLLDPISATLESIDAGAPAALNWNALALPQHARTAPRHFLTINPTDRTSAADALQAVRSAIASLPAGAARVRLTGEIPQWTDELDAAAEGAVWSALASLALVALMLLAGLRSVRLVVIALTSLIAGLLLTAGFAAWAVGRLNLISLAFAALYIGLAIDFAAHLLLHYRELMLGGSAPADAMTGAGRDVGSALLLCALTTAAAFYAFVPTSFQGVAELGLISGSGIIIGLLTSLLLMPALLRLAGHRAIRPAASSGRVAEKLAAWPFAHRRAVLVAAAIAAAVALWQLPDLRFDYNPMHLKPAGTESQRVYEELVADENSPLTANLLAPDAQSAARDATRLAQLPVTREVRWLLSFVPTEQASKLAIIEELAISVGSGLPADLQLAPVAPARDRQAMIDLRRHIADRAGADASAQQLGRALDGWLSRHTDDRDPGALMTLRDALLSGLPVLLRDLHLSLQAGPVDEQTLPDALVREWRSANGRYRLDVVPAENLNDDDALRRFARAIHDAAPAAAGAPLEYVGGARTVMVAFAQAFACAIAVIAILLLLLLRSFADSLRALAPLALGALLTAGICAATGLKLNFANIIALPLLLGIGVDNGIHLIWRARHHAGNPLLGSTGRAVVIAVLTTLSSFASLMLSAHRGMASMGAMLTLGLLLMLVCSFAVLPALLPPREDIP